MTEEYFSCHTSLSFIFQYVGVIFNHNMLEYLTYSLSAATITYNCNVVASSISKMLKQHNVNALND